MSLTCGSKPIAFTSDESVEIDGIKFRLSVTDYTFATDEQSIALLKNRELIELYDNLLYSRDVKNMLELGAYEGGTGILFTTLKDDLKYLGIDHLPEPAGLTKFLQSRQALQSRLAFYYNTSQDSEALPELVRHHFADTELDLVIDDCSHQYPLTKRAFELIFPLLKRGGLYIIEDWGWQHWRNWPIPDVLKEGPPQTQLLLELLMATASNERNLIDHIEVHWNYFIVSKGQAEYAPGFKLEDYIELKGRELHWDSHHNVDQQDEVNACLRVSKNGEHG